MAASRTRYLNSTGVSWNPRFTRIVDRGKEREGEREGSFSPEREKGARCRLSSRLKRNVTNPEDNVARAAGVIERVCNNAAVSIYNRYTARNDENRVVWRRREGRYTQRCAACPLPTGLIAHREFR